MMGHPEELRWKQRHNNFGKALGQLEAACAKPDFSELERAGLVQVFEFTFELAWKSLKDLLSYEGISAGSPREVLRAAFKADFLGEADTESLLDALDKRNLLARTYEERIAAQAEKLITAAYAPALRRVFDVLQERRARA